MIAEIEVTPIGEGEHIAGPVSHVVRLIADSGLDYQVTSMGTIVEGEPDQVWALIRKCHEQGTRDARRVMTQIRIDDDLTGERRMHRHVQRVEEELGDLVKKSA